MKKIFIFLTLLLFPITVSAQTLNSFTADSLNTDNLTFNELSIPPRRTNITEWYVQNFETNIIVNQDSSLDITEKITADIGDVYDKHGIFRVLPTRYLSDQGNIIFTPIVISSVTDFSGKNRYYTTTIDSLSGLITLRIADDLVNVSGVNEYMVTYHVKNGIDYSNSDYDRFNWNITGNSWDMEIDQVVATIRFPDNVTENQIDYKIYYGSQGGTNNISSTASWNTDNTLSLTRTELMRKGDGITIDAKLPKNTFTAAKLGLFDIVPFDVFWLIIPLFLFPFVFWFWYKYGRDPKKKAAIVAEYDPPDELSPGEISYLQGGGGKDKFIAAELVYLATNKYLKIEEIKGSFLGLGKDFQFTLLNRDFSKLKEHQRILIRGVFMDPVNVIGKIGLIFSGKPKITPGDYDPKNEVDMGLQTTRKLSALKNKFTTTYTMVEKLIKAELVSAGYLDTSGSKNQIIILSIGGFFAFLAYIIASSNFFVTASFGISAAILIIFGILMDKVTPKGAEARWRIEGLRYYMNIAEKYRQRFYEKEGIFEKLLPYAIVFGITKEWAKKMEDIYGKEYFNTYAPVWYVGSFNNFNADSFSSAMSSVSSSVASSSMSGSGGAGGGGGGGGGGGC